MAVLDDDPTGSQAVHDVAVVTAFDEGEYLASLGREGSVCFIWTNSRSLSDDGATTVNVQVASGLFAAARRAGFGLEIVSRSDSTLRGHFMAEVRALERTKREATGRGYDAVLFIPAYFEAGRVTLWDVQWVLVGDEWLPAARTEFSRDASFGYAASNLREYIAEKSGGAIRAEDVWSISLEDIRVGGVARVVEILERVTAGTFVVVNAVLYEDLEVVVLALAMVEGAGRSFLYRTGPSFVRALAGIEPREPIAASELWPLGRPPGHGLVVVGSHVAVTNRQLAAMRAVGGLAEVELDVARVINCRDRDAYLAEVTKRVIAALVAADVLLVTSRRVNRVAGGNANLKAARIVSTALSRVAGRALAGRPSWIVAKGGITSHDVAVQGLGMRRATVVGQVLPGMVSVLQPIDAAPEAVGIPYVVFAGNVGGDDALAKVVAVLRGKRLC
ncbi:MAG TPA: four-carbon acid sugar kinase family protein [Candidatus Acidoferrales bacterium]|nr:four-carbon acid sugar kinase family protein [Candidatus Acidoferrales bacterium]